MENQKIMKSATVVDKFLKVFQGFSIAGVICAVIFIPLTAIFGEKVIASASKLELGALDVNLAGELSSYLDIPAIKVSIIVSLISMILLCAAFWYCLRVLREILVPMKAGTPFAQGISDKIRKLGWAILIGGGVAEIGRAVSSVFELKAYHIEKLINMDMVSEVSYDYNFSLWFVITALILFFLAYVFRYGESLQQEADETL